MITQEPDPIYTAHLFGPMRAELLRVLRSLDKTAWHYPTACTGWTVKDIALHMLGGDVGLLSRRRDGFSQADTDFQTFEQLVAFINLQNDIWLRATRRMSTEVLVELLDVTGAAVAAWMTGIDPHSTGAPVDWVGNGPAPAWMELAREHTEYWVHHQHICDAVNVESLREPVYAEPVLAAFVRSLPRAYAGTPAANQTTITIKFTGDVVATWHLMYVMKSWRLLAHTNAEAACTVTLDSDAAWRSFTKGATASDVRVVSEVTGEAALAGPFFEAVAILA